MPDALARHSSRCSQIFWTALSELETELARAVERWGPDRVGLVVGSSTGGIDVTEQVVALEHRGDRPPWDYDFDAVHPFSALLHVARAAFGIRGPSYVVSTACSSSGKAVAAAQRLLEADLCDAVVTGGADALCQMTLRGFACLGILSERACRPFDEARDGISIGEGSAVLLVERHSNSPVAVLGAGESNDAFHTTAPHPEGLGAQLALRAALELSGVEPDRVDYVNAHGTGTRQNDAAEATALAAVLGRHVAYASTKDRVGHQLGAAGATEAAFCLDALAAGLLPGNRPGTNVDPALALPPLLADRPCAARVALSNSFAFGGSNVTLALGWTGPEAGPARSGALRAENAPVPSAAGRAWVEAVGFWAPGYPSLRSLLDGQLHGDETRPPALLLPARPRGRASVLTRLFAELFGQVAGERGATLPAVYGSALGEMTTTLSLLDQLGQGETLSPAGFQASVHNTAAGVISIALGNRSFSTALAAGSETLAMSVLEGLAWLSVHGGSIAVLVADEEAPTRLRRQGHYPAAGLAFLLTWADAPPPGALGSIERLAPKTGPNTSGGDAELRRELALRLPGLERAPASHGLALARALVEGRRGAYAVGDEWIAEVTPAPRA
jgi:3-oxoacyl-[acyl-carrier-protein] synthase-1